MTREDAVQAEQSNGILVLTVSRPQALNALNRRILAELRSRLLQAERDDAVRVTVITGEGGKAFAAGADIGEFMDLADEQAGREYARHGQEIFAMIASLTKPVIAAINGYALGGGLELALACDIRCASERATFGFPEATLGILPGFGGIERAARLIGRSASLQLMLTGMPIDAAEALRLGLVDRVVAHDGLMREVLALAARMAEQPPAALAAIKECLGRGMEAEAALFGRLVVSDEARSRCRAFLEKRRR
ncbi:enoyl-CoA hydratase/isomerase family protein [Paenibacillus cymbidii]|uniref:enoyl-CoA hydratase/isomerase family protein n=1 Tax=Paenibacillus cymbidii TaxID=1639034 RepID=UPI0010822ABA|nr:enoyl-CoA hydratase-related protein [Paenibacillus cymbidii]